MHLQSLVFCLAVCLVAVQAASYSVLGNAAVVAGWTGALDGPDYSNKKWIIPTLTLQYSTPCVLDTGSYGTEYYVALPVSFTTTGVRKIIGYSQVISGQDFFKAFVYEGSFDPSSGCTNIVTRLGGDEGYLDDHVLFTANTQYTIVVSSLNSVTRFAVNVLESIATGSTAGSGQLTNFGLSSTGTCTKYGVTSPYFAYTWTQATTGSFDINVGYALNQTNDAWKLAITTLALYSGTVTADQLAAQNVCTSNLLTVGESNQVARDVIITARQLTAGSTYTVVSFNTYDTAYASYGLYVTPSNRRPFTGQGYKQPLYKNYMYSDDKDRPTGCDPDPDRSASGYFAFKFTALYDNVAINTRMTTDIRNIDDPPMLYLYEGDNTANPPSTCGTKLLRRHDMYYGTFWFNTEPGTTYTIVGAGIDGEPFGSSLYVPVYVLTGSQVGSTKASAQSYQEGDSSSASALQLCFVTVLAVVSALLM